MYIRKYLQTKRKRNHFVSNGQIVRHLGFCIPKKIAGYKKKEGSQKISTRFDWWDFHWLHWFQILPIWNIFSFFSPNAFNVSSSFASAAFCFQVLPAMVIIGFCAGMTCPSNESWVSDIAELPSGTLLLIPIWQLVPDLCKVEQFYFALSKC